MSNPNGSWLTDWRARNGYTQEELAKELEVTRQSVVKWEQAESLDRVLALALLALEEMPKSQQIGARRSMKIDRKK